MTDGGRGSKPELKLGSHLVPGLVAVALFVVLAAVFVGASFGTAAGFEDTHVAANVTVTDNTSANVTTAVENGSTVALIDGNESVAVSDDPDANVSIVQQDGQVIAQVIEPTSVTESIGYAMFNIDQGSIDAEGFLVAFILIAVVLDVAIDGAVFLAKSEDGDEPGTALPDGGEETRGTLAREGDD